MRFRIGIPKNEDYFDMPEHDRMYSVYGNVTEELPRDLQNQRARQLGHQCLEMPALCIVESQGDPSQDYYT